MKEILKIATAQFENRSGDKEYNLGVIRSLAQKASGAGADVIAFHECSITGYTFARNLSKDQMLNLAEDLTDSASVRQLESIAADYNIVVLAGLFEKDKEDNLFKAYICVDKDGLIADNLRSIAPW